MLDSFEILTTSGTVLWQRSYAPVSPSVINSLIKDVFIEETVSYSNDASASQNPPYKADKYTLKWATVKDLGLIFVAVYQSLLHLPWVDQLLDNIKAIFTSLYQDQFKKPYTCVVDCPFDGYFDRQLESLQVKAGTRESAPPHEVEDDTLFNKISEDSPAPPQSSAPEPLRSLGGKTSRRARKQPGPVTTSKSPVPAQGRKQKRRWDHGGGAASDEDDQLLDYSTTGTPDETPQEVIQQKDWARKTGQGEVVLKDLDDEMAEILSTNKPGSESTTSSSSGLSTSAYGAVTGLFRSVVGGKKLTASDLQKPLSAMQNHLIGKNVERTAASRLCNSVQADLLDTRTSSFQSPDAAIANSMERALTKIMTPTSSLDLLRSIAARTAAAPLPTGGKRPYVISVVGVNGVGKSTTLAKLAFLLLHNNHRVLVCGADTFRSGAVEQLRVHVRALQSLIHTSSTAENPLGSIDLYERGYGKDPAHIARDAVAHASTRATPFDVVLIDTAGRRHNDTRLMSSLEGFARLANPDKIFMVGEALVGSDAVAQARDFNAAFGAKKGLDGFIVSKCDTVGEMVGTIVSMVHATGVPVIAVGVGQHYGDLRTLNVGWACRLLMS